MLNVKQVITNYYEVEIMQLEIRDLSSVEIRNLMLVTLAYEGEVLILRDTI